MKLTSLIATLLMSSTLIQGAAAFEETDASVADGDQYWVIHAKPDEHPDARALMYGQDCVEIVYFDTIIREEQDYVVCMTDNPLSHAFVPRNSETLLEWQKVADFLFELLMAGVDYAIEHQAADQAANVRSLGVKFLSSMMGLAYRVNISCFAGYIPEAFLNTLYQGVLASIDEVGQGKDALAMPLINSMYVPIRDWIKSHLPICCMYEFVKPKVTLGVDRKALKQVDYWFQPDKYYLEYFKRTKENESISEFAEKTPAHRMEYGLDWNKFVLCSTEEKSKVALSKEQKDREGNGIMEYVRFLESIKDAEKAFVNKWMVKIQEAEALLEARRQKAQAFEQDKQQKKQLDPKEVLAQMMRDLGLEDDEVKHAPKKKQETTKSPAKAPQPSGVQQSPKQGKKAKAKMQHVELTDDAPHIDLDDDTMATTQVTSASVSPGKPSRKTPPSEEITEEERLQRIAEYEAMNAHRKAAVEERKQMLLERKEEQDALEEMMFKAVHRRVKKSWVEEIFETPLSPLPQELLIDPSIFDGSPDFEETKKILEAAGIYVNDKIHGNEKGVARWVGADGKNVMVWFDRPHGAQLRMGESAGWVRAFVSTLKKSGRLLTR